MIEGDNKVDGEETKRIKQCVSFAEFVRLKRPQNIGFAKIFQRQSVVEKTLVGRRRVAAVGGGAGGRADGHRMATYGAPRRGPPQAARSLGIRERNAGCNIAAARSRQNERLTAMEGRRRGVLDARQEAAARRAARRAHLGRIAVPIMCNLHCLQ